MAIIAISRGSYSKGKKVAERVADKLGYRCISRVVIIEASRDFNIPEILLHRAIHDAPSILEKLTSITFGREKYISYFETTLLRILAQMDTFKTTVESQKTMDDMVLAAEVKAALINLIPYIKVVAKDGIVVVSTTLPLRPPQIQELKEIAGSIVGVKSIDVKLSH
jgi:hypothetical protein